MLRRCYTASTSTHLVRVYLLVIYVFPKYKTYTPYSVDWQKMFAVLHPSEFSLKTLPKAQRTRGLSSYHKLVHKSWSNFNFRILIKHQLQKLNQTSVSRLNLNLKSLPNLASESWPIFNIVTSTKHQQQNTDQTSASKSRLNFNFKTLAKPQLPNL